MIRTTALTKRFPGPKDGAAVLAVDRLDLQWKKARYSAS